MDNKTLKILCAMASVPVALTTAHAAVTDTAVITNSGDKSFATWNFHHENVLGTSLEITIQAKDLASAHRAEAAALAAFDHDTSILSAWRADSEFSRWAATRFTPTPVSPELFDVLSRFDHWRERTGGALDASTEAATRLWQQAAAEGRTPNAQEIAETVESMQQPHWSLDKSARTATRLTGVPLALASFTKSYITSKAADRALQASASGVVLNVGGDVVARGTLTQIVAIANPLADAENDAPMDHIFIRNRSVATSGLYRRGFDLSARNAANPPQFSHIINPRTAQPTAHILSSTVIAKDAETAAALATAFSVLPVVDSQKLAAETPGTDYLIVTREGEQVTSAGWSGYQTPRFHTAAYTPPARLVATAGAWNPQFELAIALELPKATDARYRRPYVAMWIEDADHFPVRTLALWTQNPRWLPELKQWYRDDQIRNLSEGTDVSKTISSATRPPGKYTLKWDGKDNEGKPVKAGKYTVCVESSREHGGYQIERREMDFDGQPQQSLVPAGKELGQVTFEYRKR
jgi:thiamine biosynthesis lipoprotein